MNATERSVATSGLAMMTDEASFGFTAMLDISFEHGQHEIPTLRTLSAYMRQNTQLAIGIHAPYRRKS